ncbi:unnamed protein product [Vitrella brassicaformis CCMP3155]|uniref:Carrier domain-containing protein n=1 Tax=Vitrella brassicaformis (strain CCMP3155) TaxID=1169540 RepID=A0A0G4E878_VITBC|nr:unnamed protein product [Vitrella brassicaformis CCMP3155]|mmetsp:Transcript_44730/g.111232  ORF Transcript_44730/g.111232 Transcript_44730/m.111232 type:complete len:143 (+) Transcript_44730:1252-1680(+)|eukprot:CEL91775.1 unnamed protein product [Vitrella brassicaformis CCMP3155]
MVSIVHLILSSFLSILSLSDAAAAPSFIPSPPSPPRPTHLRLLAATSSKPVLRESDIVITVKEVLADVSCKSVDEISEEDHINFDLMLDSVGQVEALARVEEELDITIPEDDYESSNFYFVRSAIEYLVARAKEEGRLDLTS